MRPADATAFGVRTERATAPPDVACRPSVLDDAQAFRFLRLTTLRALPNDACRAETRCSASNRHERRSLGARTSRRRRNRARALPLMRARYSADGRFAARWTRGTRCSQRQGDATLSHQSSGTGKNCLSPMWSCRISMALRSRRRAARLCHVLLMRGFTGVNTGGPLVGKPFTPSTLIERVREGAPKKSSRRQEAAPGEHRTGSNARQQPLVHLDLSPNARLARIEARSNVQPHAGAARFDAQGWPIPLRVAARLRPRRTGARAEARKPPLAHLPTPPNRADIEMAEVELQSHYGQLSTGRPEATGGVKLAPALRQSGGIARRLLEC